LAGVRVDFERVRRRVAETSVDPATDFSELATRIDVARDALRTLDETVRSFDAKTEPLDNERFKKGRRFLELASGAANESRRAGYLELAKEAFVDSYSLLKNERLIAARFGAASASIQRGELATGWATLENIASISFDAKAPRSDFATFSRLKRETRDFLARLGGVEALTAEVAAPCGTSDGENGGNGGDGVWASNPAPGTRATLEIAGVEFPFRYCPPGTFIAGSPRTEDGREDEGVEQEREVTLTRGFWTLETPVTQGMWKAITGTNPSRFRLGDDYPAETVSWFAAQDFLELLNAANVAPPGFEFRLPWEAEWERACRAGTTTAFYWGDAFAVDRANCDGTRYFGADAEGVFLERTTPVRNYPPNPWGLFDMCGNVCEWLGDWNKTWRDKSGVAPKTNPTGPKSGKYRALRGGAWSLAARCGRSAARSCQLPTVRLSRIGVRVVLARKG
ncbi:MAG: formylglycine-generating enzyme family protein, partial [Thermoguttaceae bacterium]|nr:formylglycine-generating enzyme family protein [Thermoguttaceae bacterium]